MLLIYSIKQVTKYTNKIVGFKLNLALLSITSPQCGKNVTCIELTLLSRNVAQFSKIIVCPKLLLLKIHTISKTIDIYHNGEKTNTIKRNFQAHK